MIGPTFYTDVELLDFGSVAFGFPSQKLFTIFNTSTIPLNYVLRIPAELPAAKEIEISPSQGEPMKPFFLA